MAGVQAGELPASIAQTIDTTKSQALATQKQTKWLAAKAIADDVQRAKLEILLVPKTKVSQAEFVTAVSNVQNLLAGQPFAIKVPAKHQKGEDTANYTLRPRATSVSF